MLEKVGKIDTAKMHKLAQLNPYNSVVKVLDDYDKPLVGVKNSLKMPMQFVRDHFGQPHTCDAASLGGRAIDVLLKNPVTGRPMTGSSSGTAINVFVGINDIGIGLDGGGSVLAPAASLQLFSYVSPLLACEDLQALTKTSTDGIEFRPSLGFMTRNFEDLLWAVRRATDEAVPAVNETSSPNYILSEHDYSAPRRQLLDYLANVLPKYDFVVSREGPIDTFGFGDTVLGHFPNMHDVQKRANKGLMRVVNMAGATAITLPTSQFGVTDVLICQSIEDKINKMITYAASIATEPDNLLARYFGDIDMYFEATQPII